MGLNADCSITRFFCVLVIISAIGADVYGGETSEPKDVKSDYSDQWSVIPGIGFTPETSWMAGALVAYQFKPDGAGADTRPSDINLSGFYTINEQMLVELSPRILFPGESWVLEGTYEFLDFPDKTWGIGPNTPWGNQTALTYQRFNLEQTALKQLFSDFYVGPKVGFTYTDGIEPVNSSGNRVDISELIGNNGTELYTLGAAIRLDERDSMLAPTRNHFIEFSLDWSPTALSSHAFRRYRLDMRKYFDLTGDGSSVLALQGLFQFTNGDVPYLEKATLGGDNILRGYHEGRYRDDHSGQLQLEFRQKIWWRFGLTAFTAAGDVWSSVGELELNQPKWAAGGGLRFNLNPEDTMNLRLDYGAGPNTSGFYILVGEAF